MKAFALHAMADDDRFEEGWEHASAFPAARGESDFCSKEGALALKEKIEAYWRERGQNVMLSLHNVGFHAAIRAARYDVRSDMVNGMPRTAPKGAAKRPIEDDINDNIVDLDDYANDEDICID